VSAPTEPGQADRAVAGRYLLKGAIGSGGMGTVWVALDQLLGRQVAVKEITPPPDVTQEESLTLRERTLREARTAARLSHPNIVTVYDVVEDGDRPWIVMELIQARSLRDVVLDDGPLTVQRAAAVGLQVLAALRAAHLLGIVHRDVKPGNVLIDGSGRAVLADFGIARALDSQATTTSGVLVGSPSYIAPERARGERGGPESDFWSLGATLYAAVEGRPPYDRDGPLPTLTAVVTQDPDPPRRAGALWPVISGLLRRDQHQRLTPDAAEAMLARIARAQDPPATAPFPAVTGPAARGRKKARRARAARPLSRAERTLTFHPTLAPATGATADATAGAAAAPAPAERAPAGLAAADLTPAGPAPAGLIPADQTPAEPAPADLAPADLAPAEPGPADLAPADLAPAEPGPADLAPAEPGPAEPAPAEPAPAGPPAGGPGPAAPEPPAGPHPAPAPVQRQRQRSSSAAASRPSASIASVTGADDHPGLLAPPGPRPPEREAGGSSGRRRLGWLGAAAAVIVAVVLLALNLPGWLSPPGTQGRHRSGTGTAASHRPGASSAAAQPSRTAGPGAGAAAAVPAGYHRYHDPTGFSIAVPDGWQVSHEGHYVYVRPPVGARFLLIDQSGHPKPNPLADWRQQEANRIGTYPGYHRVRLAAVSYPQAERAADWEFTYNPQGGPTHVLSRNVLANSRHAYALYWSTPSGQWARSFPVFRVLAATFQPAPA
jgi:hypothetical protein